MRVDVAQTIKFCNGLGGAQHGADEGTSTRPPLKADAAMGKPKAGAGPIVPVPSKVTSRKHARRLTSAYHTITHKLAAASTESERAACRAELKDMGGVEAYQQASALNTALNPTSRWVKRALAALQKKGSGAPRILEIGAVNTQLLDAPGLEVRAIDLHASHPRIEQRDFLYYLDL